MNEEMKKYLDDRLMNITDELKTIAIHNEETDDWIAIPEGAEVGEADPNTEADVVEGWNERRAILSTLETEYQNVKRALRKIEDGTFGICEIDGSKIEEERLRANPTARTSIANMARESELSL